MKCYLTVSVRACGSAAVASTVLTTSVASVRPTLGCDDLSTNNNLASHDMAAVRPRSQMFVGALWMVLDCDMHKLFATTDTYVT